MGTAQPIDDRVRRFLESRPIGIVATRRADGRARQTTVYYVVDGSTIWISTEAGRAKPRDIERDGWASLCVVGSAAPYPSVTVEGPAAIVDNDIAPMTARIIARITGGTPSELTESDLKATGRVLLRIDIERVYGTSYLSETAPWPVTGPP